MRKYLVAENLQSLTISMRFVTLQKPILYKISNNQIASHFIKGKDKEIFTITWPPT